MTDGIPAPAAVPPREALEKAIGELAWCCTYYCDWYAGQKYRGVAAGAVAYTLVSGIRMALAAVRDAAPASLPVDASRILSEIPHFVDSAMAMLRARAEEGQIHIADPGVEGFIRDALCRITVLYLHAAPQGGDTLKKEK